jgi:hypothetical protein
MLLLRAPAPLSLLIITFATLVEMRAGEVSHEDPLPKILRAWDHRRHELNCVEWRFSGRTIWSKNLDKKSPDGTAVVEGKLDVTARFNFAKNRFRREVEWDSYFGDTDGVEHRHTIAVASGGTLTVQILPGSADLKKFKVDYVVRTGEPGEMPTGDMDLLYWRPILWASGIV